MFPSQHLLSLLKVAQPIAPKEAHHPVQGWKAPTEAQQKAGNYRKYTFRWKGLHIAIENPKGSHRSGKDRYGRTWRTELKNAYGYIKGTLGVDGDPLDVFVGPDLHAYMVYVVNQVDPLTRKFDEHKAIIGAKTKEQAKAIYLANFQKGWQGLGRIRSLPHPCSRFGRGAAPRTTTKEMEPAVGLRGRSHLFARQLAERYSKTI